MMTNQLKLVKVDLAPHPDSCKYPQLLYNISNERSKDMLLENVKAYTSSKNDVEVILNGEYTTNGKVLNGRQRYEDTNGKVFWVPSCKPDGVFECEVTDSNEDTVNDFFAQIKEKDAAPNTDTSTFFASISESKQTEITSDTDVTTASGSNHYVDSTPSVTGKYHKVRRNDSIESIAAEYGVSRNLIASQGSLYIGKKVRVTE